MGNKCSIPENDVNRMKKYPQLAEDNVKYGVYSQRQVSDCMGGVDQPSTFDKLKGALGDAFAKAKEAVTPLDQAAGNTLKLGAQVVANGVENNSGLSGQAADALRGRGEQLRKQEAAALGM